MKKWLYLISLMLSFVANTNAANSNFLGVREVVAAKGGKSFLTLRARQQVEWLIKRELFQYKLWMI